MNPGRSSLCTVGGKREVPDRNASTPDIHANHKDANILLTVRL